MPCTWGVLYLIYACTEGVHMPSTRGFMYNILGMYRRSTYAVYTGIYVQYFRLVQKEYICCVHGEFCTLFMHVRKEYICFVHGEFCTLFLHVRKEYI